MGESRGWASEWDRKMIPSRGPLARETDSCDEGIVDRSRHTCTVNQDRFKSGIPQTVLVPVLRLPLLHMEELMSVVIPTVVIIPQGTRDTHSPRQTDQRLISCGGAKCPD